MKIFIGPYKTGITYSKVKKFLKKFFLSDDFADKITVNLFGNKFFRFVFRIGTPEKNRNIKVVIDDYDIWNGYHTLAIVILPLLIKLRDNKQGSPAVDNSDVPEYLQDDNNKQVTTSAKYFERWDYVMDEMIWAFGEIVKDSESITISKKTTEDMKKEYFDRIQNGVRLFAKYYLHLWD